MARPDIIIEIGSDRLSDGSQVFAVYLRETDMRRPVQFDANSEKDASSLAEKLRAAIDAHTNLTVDLRS